MSDEERSDEEIEFEGHSARPGENDEPVEDVEDEFQAHVMRMD